MSATHSNLSPSSAERWMKCPGSVYLSTTVPKPKSNAAASEGTACHTLAEELVTGRATEAALRKRLGQVIQTWDGFAVKITTEMIDGAVLYDKIVRALIAEFKTGSAIVAKPEVKVIASSIDGEVRGTADYIIYQIKRRLVVIDFKFGKKAVNPVENKQMGIYLVGAMDSLAKSDDFDELELIVVQPRAGGKPVRRWIVPKEWIVGFRKEMKAAALATREKNAKLSAGNWCFFCPVKGAKRPDGTLACPEIAKELQRQAQIDFSVVPVREDVRGAGLPEAKKMAAESIAKVLSWKGVILSWLQDLEERGKEMREVGLDVPGYKLVESRTHRKWSKDEKEVVEDLALYLDEDAIYESRALKSPSQIEELLGKKGLLEKMELVSRAKGETILVTVDDSRPEIASSAAGDFGATIACSDIEGRLFGASSATREVSGDIVDDLLGDLMSTPQILAPKKEERIEDLLGDLMEKKREPLWPV